MKMSWKKIFKYIALILVVFFVGKSILNREGTKTASVNIITTVSTSGEIKSKREAELSFGVTGEIAEIYVEKGEDVTKGDLLAIQNNYSLSQSIQAYKDARDITLRDRDLFIENYETNLSGYGGMDEFEINLRKHDETVSKAEATYQSNRATLQDTYIYAPFGGQIIDLYYEESESVTLGTAVIKIADQNDLVFEITVDQEDFGLLKEDQNVDVELDAYEDVIFSGVVSELPSYANGGDSPSFTVEIKILGEESLLTLVEETSLEVSQSSDTNKLVFSENKPLLGMTGDAHIIVEETLQQSPSLFYDEIFFDEEDNPYIWVVKDGLIVKQNIEIGLAGDIYTEVKSQVQDTIIVGINDDVEIKEGYKAKIVK